MAKAEEFEAWFEGQGKQLLESSKEKRFCIVSIIGKSFVKSDWSKASIINDVMKIDAFHSNSDQGPHSTNKLCKIEVFADVRNGAIYLHLISPNDAVQFCNRLLEEDKDIYDTIQDYEFEFARNCLFLFSISHIILLSHDNCVFDVTYVRFLRALDNLRLKTQSWVSERLQSIARPTLKNWISNGRPCCPRLLFLFKRPPILVDPEKKFDVVRKLQTALEDQIYRILRKSRVITNNSSNSICAVPANEGFVHVVPVEKETPTTMDWLMDYIENLAKDPNYGMDQEYEDMLDEDSSCPFADFLLQHVDIAHTKGFDDNLGRNAFPTPFELPKLKHFHKIALDLYDFFMNESEVLSEALFSRLFSVELSFSQSRCAKVLPIAKNAYRDNLPDVYTEAHHQLQVAQALRVLSTQARGPALEGASKKLVEECEKFWKDGRQACEVCSLTGNNCLNKTHVTPDVAAENEKDLPVMEHYSNVKFLSTCNCGLRQAIRDDPFDLKEANYNFYKLCEDFVCCAKLETLGFPIFRPSTDNVKEAALLMDGLHIATQSQDGSTTDNTASRGPTMSNEFLPDEDNKHLRQGNEDQISDLDLPSHDSQLSPKDVLSIEVDKEEDERGSEEDKDNKEDQSQEPGEFKTDDEGEKVKEHSPSGEIDVAEKDENDLRESQDDHNATAGEGIIKTQEENDQTDTEGSSSNLTDEKEEPPEETTEPAPEKIEKVTRSTRESLPDTMEASTVEYLPGMPHSGNPPGLLPLFPSWSLISLGSCSIYSHAHGLKEQPNFSRGSGYLLPWDVSLKVDVEKWNREMDVINAKRNVAPKKHRQAKTGEERVVSVKIFVGFEYECPRGHRFTLQSPTSILKHPGPGGPKDPGSPVAKQDMPLWFPCCCRATQPFYLAQLMRLHLVTPKAPVELVLNPRVQPVPTISPIFYPGNQAPIVLDAAKYWILRLPFVYMGDDKRPYLPAKENVASGKFLKGAFSVNSVL